MVWWHRKSGGVGAAEDYDHTGARTRMTWARLVSSSRRTVGAAFEIKWVGSSSGDIQDSKAGFFRGDKLALVSGGKLIGRYRERTGNVQRIHRSDGVRLQ